MKTSLLNQHWGGGGGGGCDRYDGSFYFGGLVSFYKGSSPLIMFGY